MVVECTMPEIFKRPGRAQPRRPRTAFAVACLVSMALSASAAQNPASSPLSSAQPLQFLDQTINSYRGLTTQQQIASTPTEIARAVFSTLQPKTHVRLVVTGAEVVIRHPVDLKNAANIDERVVREPLRSLEQYPKLHLIAGGGIHLADGPGIEAKG
jgi:hypothetical protein